MLQYQVGVGLEGGILPGLRHPGVDEVLMGFRVMAALEVLFGNIREPHERGVEGVDPEAHPLAVGAVLLDHPPLPEPEHLPLVLVGDNSATLRAGVHRQLRPVHIIRVSGAVYTDHAGKVRLAETGRDTQGI